MWIHFVRKRGEIGQPTLIGKNVCCGYEYHGLATRIVIKCKRREKSCDGHETQIEPEMIKGNDKQNNSVNYALNLRSVLSMLMHGGGHNDFAHVCNFFGVQSLSFKTYKNVEDMPGKSLSKVSKKATKKALEGGIQLSPHTYSTEKYGVLPALTVLVDVGGQN